MERTQPETLSLGGSNLLGVIREADRPSGRHMEAGGGGKDNMNKEGFLGAELV